METRWKTIGGLVVGNVPPVKHVGIWARCAKNWYFAILVLSRTFRSPVGFPPDYIKSSYDVWNIRMIEGTPSNGQRINIPQFAFIRVSAIRE